MININEFRLGNWIRNINPEYDFQLTTENISQVFSTPEKYKPTPMSWEFVENTIAVEDLEANDEDEEDGIEDIGWRVWEYPISEKDSVDFSISENGVWTFITGDNDLEFQNVHTFQNYIFAWTGGLEIKYKQNDTSK
jgi:hypothetical protein